MPRLIGLILLFYLASKNTSYAQNLIFSEEFQEMDNVFPTTQGNDLNISTAAGFWLKTNKHVEPRDENIRPDKVGFLKLILKKHTTSSDGPEWYEYVTIDLLDTLASNKEYQISAKIQHNDYSLDHGNFTKNIGIYFTEERLVKAPYDFSRIKTDKSRGQLVHLPLGRYIQKWEVVPSRLKASRPYRYATIGFFSNKDDDVTIDKKHKKKAKSFNLVVYLDHFRIHELPERQEIKDLVLVLNLSNSIRSQIDLEGLNRIISTFLSNQNDSLTFHAAAFNYWSFIKHDSISMIDWTDDLVRTIEHRNDSVEAKLRETYGDDWNLHDRITKSDNGHKEVIDFLANFNVGGNRVAPLLVYVSDGETFPKDHAEELIRSKPEIYLKFKIYKLTIDKKTKINNNYQQTISNAKKYPLNVPINPRQLGKALNKVLLNYSVLIDSAALDDYTLNLFNTRHWGADTSQFKIEIKDGQYFIDTRNISFGPIIKDLIRDEGKFDKVKFKRQEDYFVIYSPHKAATRPATKDFVGNGFKVTFAF